MVEVSSLERPVAIQLFGGSKESMLNGLEVLQKITDYDYLDINLGCPVNKVIKNNAGSSWLLPSRNEELYDCISSICKKSKKPVTCKIRLGWSEDLINVVETAKTLEKAGCKMLVIHGRTRAQLYSGKARFDLIKKVKEEVKIPVIANGDITTLDKAIEVLNYTKCDGIAIGRGCLGNPHLIRQIKTYYETGEILKDATLAMQMEYLKEHYQALYDLKGEYIATREIRGIGSWYLKGFTNVRDFKVKLSMCNTKEELYQIIDEILSCDKIKRV